MREPTGLVSIACTILATLAGTAPAQVAGAPDAPAAIEWHADYAKAMSLAREQHMMLLIFFHKATPDAAQRAFEGKSLVTSVVGPRQDRYIWVRLPLAAKIKVQGVEHKVLDSAAFQDMRGRPGLAIIDFENPGTANFGYVVSQFPFSAGHYYTPGSLSVILDLPPGTLTQRTMIFAVRSHPENPGSATGKLNGVLVGEAESHSRYQAQIAIQGHHSWETRFHRINARMPQSLIAQEVVAESWPGEELVDAAIECVHSWRRSPGHWSAVRARQPLFAFDMKRARNGIWYATGLFANRRH